MRKTHHPPLRSALRSSASLSRLLSPDGQFNILRKGAPHFNWGDLYHLLLTASKNL